MCANQTREPTNQTADRIPATARASVTSGRAYHEHALLEGAGRLQQFRRITWPLLWPQTVALVLLTTIGTLRISDMVWVMTEGGPGHATETVATTVYATAFRSLDVGYAQAMAMILVVLILVIGVIEFRLLDRRAEDVRT